MFLSLTGVKGLVTDTTGYSAMPVPIWLNKNWGHPALYI